jgi:ADP-heptose:LPS heptosyltransferase
MRRRVLRIFDKTAGPAIILGLVAFARLARLFGGSRTAAVDKRPRAFLAIKMVGLGDTVLMLTPLRALRKRFPGATICVLATPLSSGILATQGLDEVVVYDALSPLKAILGFGRLVRLLRSRKFDCVIDFEQHFLLSAVMSFLAGAPMRIGFHFQRGLRRLMFTHPVVLDPEQHMVDSFMSLLGPLGLTALPVETLEGIETSPEIEARVASWLRARGIAGDDLLVGVHPGSGPRALSRRWGAGCFAEIITRLRNTLGAKVVLTGTARESALIEEIVTLAGSKGVSSSAGVFVPQEIAALAKHCSLFISNDTGVMHIAAATGTPTIGLFGPQTPRRYAPVGPRNAHIYKPMPCSPCVEIHRGEIRSCDDAACIRSIGVEDVWTEVDRIARAFFVPTRKGE